MARSKGFDERFPVRDSEVFRALARNVERLRNKRGWTQDDLAAAAEVEQMAVSLMENRRANPTIEVLEKIAAAFDVTFVDLFSTEERL
jgi:transcriptional regulator with XRE-family HTH domain